MTFSPLFIGSRIVTLANGLVTQVTRTFFQSPFHRVKDCNRPRAALINPSRMSRVSVFFDTFCVSSHQTSPRSSKKCTSPAHLVFMPIHGAVIADFANRLLVLPGVRSLVAIRESRSQIHPPFSRFKGAMQGKHKTCPDKRGQSPFASDSDRKRLTSGSDTE